MAKIPVALQMYTVREDAGRDFVGTLRKVVALGYAGVEFAGTGGMTAPDLKRLLDDLGLQVAGSHVGLDTLEGALDAALEYNLTLGNRFVVCPWLPEDRRRDADDYRRLADVLNDIGRACRELGLQFCYHNHAFELQSFNGQTGLDILFEATDPDLVKAELDTYWVEYGGASAVEYLRRYAGRTPLVHLKDMADDPQRSFAEVGTGTMDFDAIFAASEAAGVEWYIVEQDTCQRPPLESVEISLKNLRARGIA